jgi:hypothetical protein
MSELTITCPACEGKKQLPCFVAYAPGFSGPPVRLMNCPDCAGLGTVTQEFIKRKQLGESMRNYRVNILQMGLREAANEWGMKPSELCQIESGRVVSDWRPLGYDSWSEPAQ